MFREARPVAVAIVAALALGLTLGPASALAHEHRTIDNGKYDVTVGWDQEPTYVGLPNAASIRISQGGSNPAVPVTGADQTLQVRIIQGTESRTFPLKAVSSQPGYYVASIVPTREGDYQWVFTGTLNGDSINETFDSADGKFDKAVAASGIQFPVAWPDPAQNASAAASAASTAQTALYLGIAGIVLGLVALALGLLAWTRRPVASRAANEVQGTVVARQAG